MNTAVHLEYPGLAWQGSVWVDYVARECQRALDNPASPCKVCTGEARLFDVLDFAKTCGSPAMPCGPVGVPVYYRRCERCAFIFTEFCDAFTPGMWTGLLYDTSYYDRVDPDYAEVRPRGNAQAVDALLCDDRPRWLGLDYGGGNGEACGHLRAMGYRYDTHDPFGASAMASEHVGHYTFCSTFEVAEHSPDPKGFMADIVRLCSSDRLAILIGTHVHDRHVAVAGNLAWWYAAPRNGHISLHSRESLATLARQFSLSCCSFTENTHLITRGYSQRETRAFLVKGKLRGRLRQLLR